MPGAYGSPPAWLGLRENIQQALDSRESPGRECRFLLIPMSSLEKNVSTKVFHPALAVVTIGGGKNSKNR
jgi:hypothetical protein